MAGRRIAAHRRPRRAVVIRSRSPCGASSQRDDRRSGDPAWGRVRMVASSPSAADDQRTYDDRSGAAVIGVVRGPPRHLTEAGLPACGRQPRGCGCCSHCGSPRCLVLALRSARARALQPAEQAAGGAGDIPPAPYLSVLDFVRSALALEMTHADARDLRHVDAAVPCTSLVGSARTTAMDEQRPAGKGPDGVGATPTRGAELTSTRFTDDLTGTADPSCSRIGSSTRWGPGSAHAPSSR